MIVGILIGAGLMYVVLVLIYGYFHPSPPGAFDDFEELR